MILQSYMTNVYLREFKVKVWYAIYAYDHAPFFQPSLIWREQTEFVNRNDSVIVL
jgi:hypothetical protein